MKLKRPLSLCSVPVALAAGAFFSIASAIAADIPYVPGTGWATFTFYNPWSGGNQRNADGEFSFTVYPGQNAVLTVSDTGWNSERFEIYNKGNWTGWTSSQPGPIGQHGQHWTSGFDETGGGLTWSAGSWPLAAGTYKLAFGMNTWSGTKTDVNGQDIFRGGFKVEILETPDGDGDKIADPFETGTGIYVSPVDTGTDPSKSDTDGDGLGDWTEIWIRKTDPNKAGTDGDGFRDLAEIEAGKSPTDPASNPDALMECSTAVEVTFYTQAGSNYQVEWSEDLVDWTALPEVIPGDGNPVTRFHSTKGSPKRYFRAVKLTGQ